MSLQDFVSIKRVGLDLTEHLDLGTEDDNYGTDDASNVPFDASLVTDDLMFDGSSTFSTHITTLTGYNSLQEDTVCFDKSDGEDYIVVTTADLCKDDAHCFFSFFY
jgi:hypothetical protein